MENNDNILSGYCFLAALTENQNDLFNHVFVPICKRTLSLYSLQGSTHGNASDIKDLILQEYGIDIPTVMVRRLINASFKSLSKRARNKYNFTVFQVGESFEIQKYAFSDLEIQYKKSTRNAKALQNAFQSYLTSEGVDIDKSPSFTDFLNKNKKHLSSFFKGTEEINGKNIDTTYIHHIQFLEYIETSNHDLFEIAKVLYLGSIVASFLESGLDIEPKFDSNEVYYLDTPIILRALDLQKEEETEPTNELIELIRKTGGQIKVLSITIEEIYRVIENAIGNYHNSVPTTTINEAVLRLGKNRAWLMAYNAKLEENILKLLKAEKQEITNSFRDKHQKSPDIKALQEVRLKKGNAMHDVLAYLYVRDMRGGTISLFQKAKIWFLTSNFDLLKFNKSHNPHQGVSEIVLPDALTSLLWLKDPSILLSRIKKIGLSELMACTLNEEIASRELINEFEANISKINEITTDEYKTLLESVAHQSAKKIAHFNEIASTNLTEAKIEAHKIVEWEKSRKAKRIKAIKDAQSAKQEEEDKNKVLIDKLAKIESDLAGTITNFSGSTTKIEELTAKVDKQDKLIKRIFKYLALAIITGILAYIGFVYYQSLSIFVKIFNWILTAGGLFGFLNFILNAIKLFKNK
jgi:hypothetical protein